MGWAYVEHLEREVARLNTKIKKFEENLDFAINNVMGIRTPVMEGDNLAILICSMYENCEQVIDEDTSWTPDATNAYEEIKTAIKEHFERVKNV